MTETFLEHYTCVREWTDAEGGHPMGIEGAFGKPNTSTPARPFNLGADQTPAECVRPRAQKGWRVHDPGIDHACGSSDVSAPGDGRTPVNSFTDRLSAPIAKLLGQRIQLLALRPGETVNAFG